MDLKTVGTQTEDNRTADCGFCEIIFEECSFASCPSCNVKDLRNQKDEFKKNLDNVKKRDMNAWMRMDVLIARKEFENENMLERRKGGFV